MSLILKIVIWSSNYLHKYLWNYLMFVVQISFKKAFIFLKCMFNQLYIKEKSLWSCLMYVILIWGGKILRYEFCIMIWSSVHTDPIKFGSQTKQLVKMRSSFLRSRLSSIPLRQDTSILKERNANTYYWPGYILLVCWMLWHLLSLSLKNGKVFGYRACSNATRTGWCM